MLCSMGRGQNSCLTPQMTRVLEGRSHDTVSLTHLFSLLFYLPRLLPLQRGQILTTPPFQAHLKSYLLPSVSLFRVLQLVICTQHKAFFFETFLVTFGKFWPVVCDLCFCLHAHMHTCMHSLTRMNSLRVRTISISLCLAWFPVR